MAEFDGKVAFVTGAGSGIGRGVALRLAREGADVCVSDMDLDAAHETSELIQNEGRKSLTVRANVASETQVREAIAACVSGLGRLDYIIKPTIFCSYVRVPKFILVIFNQFCMFCLLVFSGL